MLFLWGTVEEHPKIEQKSGRKGAVSVDGKNPEEKDRNTAADAPAAQEPPRVRFIGSFNHSLDSKGRLVIPQTFREKLGEKFCIAPSFDFQSIAVYPTPMWEKRNQSYERLGNLNPALNRYLEQFYALSFDDQSCDGQGRILLPAGIRTKILQEERDVEITGANDHVRIVSAAASRSGWDSFRAELPGLLEMIASLERGE